MEKGEILAIGARKRAIYEETDARRHENGVTLSRYIRVGEAGPYNKPSEVASLLVARLTRVVFSSSRRLTLARVRGPRRFVVPLPAISVVHFPSIDDSIVEPRRKRSLDRSGCHQVSRFIVVFG